MSHQATIAFLANYQHIFPRLLELVDKQGCTQTQAAEILNREGYRTSLGGPLHQVIVHRMLKAARNQPRLKLVPVEEIEPGKPWENLSPAEQYERTVSIGQKLQGSDSGFVAAELAKQVEQENQAIRFATSGRMIG